MSGPPSPRSLAGIRVIDAARTANAPHCGQVLGQWGADVLTIQPPPIANTTAWGLQQPDPDTAGAPALPTRRMQLDLAQQPGRDMLLRLLADADVLIENFEPGALADWGLGHATLLRRFPRLVHCRVAGVGPQRTAAAPADSHAHLKALDDLLPLSTAAGSPTRAPTHWAVTQVAPVAQAEPDAQPPADPAWQATQAAQAVLHALQDRQRHGSGGFVEAALADAGVTLLRPRFGASATRTAISHTSTTTHTTAHISASADASAPKAIPAPPATDQPDIHRHEMLATATEPVFLAWGDDRQFVRLCQHLGQPVWAQDPRFASAGARASHRAALKDLLESCLAAHDGPTLAAALWALGVPCTPVLGVPEALTAADAQRLGYKPAHVR